MDLVGPLVGSMWAFVQPNLWWIVPLVVARLVFVFPMPGRGPRSSTRDVWRGFKYGPRAEVLKRAGERCEGALMLAWGRCGRPAVEVDHVFPYSKGGPTVVSNGQATCKHHNRSKGSTTPSWWYVLALEKRRRTYFPDGADVRVLAVMTASDFAERERGASGRGGR